MINIKETDGKVFQCLFFYCKIRVFSECGMTRDYHTTIFLIFVVEKQIVTLHSDMTEKTQKAFWGVMMCLIGILPIKGVSQTRDSLSTIEMKEVVVKARMHRTDASSSTFTPTARQKTSAQNAIDLLKQLAIPQININLMDNTVTTPSGQSVAIYINYIPASAEEMEGISTSDVRRVEYLDFPADPRFQGKEHVINFIVQQYEYGGYTKATLNENFLIGKLSSRASVYSKYRA